MKSWWDLGEGYGYLQIGEGLSLHQITCAFCNESGNFAEVFHAEKKKPNSSKKINFDTFECGSCKGYVQVTWSAQEFGGSKRLHDYRVLPWPLGKPKAPENWPKNVGRFWEQAHDSARNENIDAAFVMARSALQAALRHMNAKGEKLYKEIEVLSTSGILPKIIADWAHEIRLIANESAHPEDGTPPKKNDVKEVLDFLDFMFVYLFDLPNDIQKLRKSRADKSAAP